MFLDHLGLARFLLEQFTLAAAAYRTGLACELCTPDMRVAFSDWLYMALRRLGPSHAAEAAAALTEAGDEQDLIEDFAYQKRIQLYKGLAQPEEVLSPDADPLDVATQGFGVADYYLGQGKEAEAVALLTQVADSSYWPSFAACAAEADLLRLTKSKQVSTTVVYWIRHAHGTHNAAQEEAEEAVAEAQSELRKSDPKKYASVRKEAIWDALGSRHVDADLTPKGVGQVEALIPQAKAMADDGVQLVVTSSLRCTLKTATGAFGTLGLPFVGIDEIREVAGTFDCERRRPLTDIVTEQAEHGQFVDFGTCMELVEYWVQDRDLAIGQALERAVSALGTIAARPEQTIAVVSHGATMGVLFSGKHARVSCKIAPPRSNCEVVATILTHDLTTGMFTLEAYEPNGPGQAKL